MSQNTTVRTIAAHAKGTPLIGRTKEFKPPHVELETDSISSTFIERKRVKGAKLDNWSFKQESMTASSAKDFGLLQGDIYTVTFK